MPSPPGYGQHDVRANDNSGRGRQQRNVNQGNKMRNNGGNNRQQGNQRRHDGDRNDPMSLVDVLSHGGTSTGSSAGPGSVSSGNSSLSSAGPQVAVCHPQLPCGLMAPIQCNMNQNIGCLPPAQLMHTQQQRANAKEACPTAQYAHMMTGCSYAPQQGECPAELYPKLVFQAYTASATGGLKQPCSGATAAAAQICSSPPSSDTKSPCVAPALSNSAYLRKILMKHASKDHLIDMLAVMSREYLEVRLAMGMIYRHKVPPATFDSHIQQQQRLVMQLQQQLEQQQEVLRQYKGGSPPVAASSQPRPAGHNVQGSTVAATAPVPKVSLALPTQASSGHTSPLLPLNNVQFDSPTAQDAQWHDASVSSCPSDNSQHGNKGPGFQVSPSKQHEVSHYDNLCFDVCKVNEAETCSVDPNHERLLSLLDQLKKE